METVPAASVRKVCKGWDMFIALSVWMGFCLSRVNTFDSSLLCAWLIFLCDLIYTTDAIARTSKQACFTTIAAEFSSIAPVVITFVPYHVLVVLGLDICGVYLLLCALRAARLVKSGRITVPFASLVSATSKLIKAASN